MATTLSYNILGFIMKTLFLCFFFLLFLQLNSQTITDPLDYFPMHLGDMWNYQIIEYDYFNDDTLSISSKTYEIIGDSLLPDGYIYNVFSINNDNNIKIYYRIDTSTLTVYNNHYCEYKLNSIPDSTWIDCIGTTNYIEIDTSFVGNIEIKSSQILFLQGYGVFNRTLSKGFGLSYFEEGDLGFHTRYYLQYAKINGIEYGTKVGIQNEDKNIKISFNLSQNYPNPFNPSTTINYTIPKAGFVQLRVHDVLGREIAVLVNKNQQKGKYEVTFNASSFTSGIYFYKLQSGSFTETKKLILLQ
jgi:hypothetical protein